MKKAEKRKILQEQKRQLRESKRIVTIARVTGTKTASAIVHPCPVKVPKSIVNSSIYGYEMQWSDHKKDVKGKWSWGIERNWGDETWSVLIEPFLKTCESKKWQELMEEITGNRDSHKKHHYYDIDQICKEAQERILELEMDDNDRIFRFRLGNLKRLYGFTYNHVFVLIWYDPTHKVYPTNNN